MIEPGERLIVALDVENKEQAIAMCELIGEGASFYKVGLQLFIAEGPSIIETLKSRGVRVFLDLKLHDIPHQVANACREVVRLGVDMMTIHATGGAEMMQAAAHSVQLAAVEFRVRPPVLLGVTLLTSLNQIRAGEIGVQGPLHEHVVRLASLAQRSGLDGIVASPHEAGQLREVLGEDFVLVTPGIRSGADAMGDQKRTMGAAAAIEAGANYIVVGRPITAASDPRSAALSIAEELKRV